MFNLEIGVNQEHPKVPHDVNFREKVEKRLRGAGLKPRWEHGSVTVVWPFEGRITDGSLIGRRVYQLLEAAEVKKEALHHIHVWAKGIIFKDAQCMYSPAGRCNFYISSISHAEESYLAVYPQEYPRGLDHLLRNYQKMAEWFTLVMTTDKKVKDAKELIRNKHNFAAGASKLEDVSKLTKESIILMTNVWDMLIKSK